jgi:hypothetical protein
MTSSSSGAVSDAIWCDHCFVQVHRQCACSRGSCPLCNHHHWNGLLHKERNWLFCYMPTMLMHVSDISKFYSKDWKQLKVIIYHIANWHPLSYSSYLSHRSQAASIRSTFPGASLYVQAILSSIYCITKPRSLLWPRLCEPSLYLGRTACNSLHEAVIMAKMYIWSGHWPGLAR